MLGKAFADLEFSGKTHLHIPENKMEIPKSPFLAKVTEPETARVGVKTAMLTCFIVLLKNGFLS